MVIEFDISSVAAFKYVKEQLGRSGKALAKYLLSTALEEGHIYAMIPETTPEDLLYKFSSGGIYPQNQSFSITGGQLALTPNDGRKTISRSIFNHLKTTGSNFCMFEEPILEPTDLLLSKVSANYVVLNNEIYYLLDANTSDLYLIEDTIKQCDDFYFLCVLFSTNPENEDTKVKGTSVSDLQLKMIAESTSSFFVNAYDGEGYLVWKTNKQ